MRGPATTRRGFLRLTGWAAALGALSQIRLAPAAASAPTGAAGPRFFDARESEILTQIMERMVDTGLPDAPRLRETRAVETVDALCRSLDPSVSEPLPWLVRGFDYAPWLFDFTFTRFTKMSDAEKDASLEAWMTSRIGLRRLAFTGLRNLCFVGFYSQPETWPLIGYAGPLIARPSIGPGADS